MTARIVLRKEAYQYVLQVLGYLSSSADERHWGQLIPLEELRLIKEGVADPSPALVALLKESLRGIVSESAIDLHLVTPFEKWPLE